MVNPVWEVCSSLAIKDRPCCLISGCKLARSDWLAMRQYISLVVLAVASAVTFGELMAARTTTAKRSPNTPYAEWFASLTRECGGGCNGECGKMLASRPGLFAGEPAPTTGGVEPPICEHHRQCRSGFTRECDGGCNGECRKIQASKPGLFAGMPAPRDRECLRSSLFLGKSGLQGIGFILQPLS